MNNWKTVSPPEKIPANLVEVWGGEFGCPIKDEHGNLLGWAASMPNFEGEVVETISITGEFGSITG